MKKIVLALLMVLLVLSMLFAAMDYTKVDPLSLPTYAGSLIVPEVKIVYEDANGEYILVEINHILYAFYL